MSDKPFWETIPLHRMSKEQWESLCDGCGKCCVHKLEDEDTGEVFPTNVCCKLLDIATARCSDYRNRKAIVPDCVRLTPARLETLDWLPDSCSYLRVHRGQGLAQWHHLITGDRDSIHRARESVANRVISEDQVGDLEDHIIEKPL
jgi:uncharacterized cysteine cluster protein YcgN (CxxCxxCC family)